MFTLDSNSKSKICAKEYWYKHKLYNSILLLSFRILYLSLGYVKTKKKVVASLFQVGDLNDRQVTVDKDMTEMVEIEHIQPVTEMEMAATTTIALVNRDRFVHCGNFYLVNILVII